MIKLVLLSLSFAVGPNTNTASHDDQGPIITVHSQDSQRLQIHRAKASVEKGKVRVHGWVKPAIWFKTGVRGKLRVEAWNGERCVDVRHVRWSLMTSHYMGHFVAKFPQSVPASEIRISHVDSDRPAVCPAASGAERGEMNS